MLKYMVDGNQLAAVVVLPTGAAPSPPLEPPLEPPLDPPLEPPLDPPLDPPLELPLEPPLDAPLDPPLELLLPSDPADASPLDELTPPLECPHAANVIRDAATARATFRMGGPPRERWNEQAYRGPGRGGGPQPPA
jgi:hypothetical protein